MSDTREAWLTRAIVALRARFEAETLALPEHIHVSVGFPSRGGLRGKRGATVGQCWAGAHSMDGAPHIFVSPLHEDAIAALDTLCHEMVHACMPPGTGHKRAFVRACERIGLSVGPARSQCAGSELRAVLERLNAELGPWPHAALDAHSLPKAQGARLVKVTCRSCGYVARVTRVWLDGPGAPICPQDNQHMKET
jgi:hypothetical protein